MEKGGGEEGNRTAGRSGHVNEERSGEGGRTAGSRNSGGSKGFNFGLTVHNNVPY